MQVKPVKYTFITVKVVTAKNKGVVSVGKDIQKREPLHRIRECKFLEPYERQLEVP